ncbi:MAG: hypothetical protein IIA40_12080, partial [SAR324 cluster bacterium]|nr:hypothetical protein [SAR324 cluster bacterium]
MEPVPHQVIKKYQFHGLMQPQISPAAVLLSPLVDEALARIQRQQPLALSGLQAGGKAWLIAALAEGLPATIVVVCDSLRRAEALCEDLAFFGASRPVRLMPHWDTVPYDGFSPNSELIAQRFEALSALLAGEPLLLVTTPQAWMQGMMPIAEFQALRFGLEVGGSFPRQELIQRLIGAG